MGLSAYLVLKGKGCDEIFRILDMHGQTFGDLFRRCERWFYGSFHFTRLDIAIDDRNEVPYFTPEQLKRKCEKEEYIANSNTHHFAESKYEVFDRKDGLYRSWQVCSVPFLIKHSKLGVVDFQIQIYKESYDRSS